MSEMFPTMDDVRYDAKALRTNLTAAKEAIEICYPATWSATMERMADEFELMQRLLKEAECPNNCKDGMHFVELVTGRHDDGSDAVVDKMVDCQWCADAEPYREGS